MFSSHLVKKFPFHLTLGIILSNRNLCKVFPPLVVVVVVVVLVVVVLVVVVVVVVVAVVVHNVRLYHHMFRD